MPQSRILIKNARAADIRGRRFDTRDILLDVDGGRITVLRTGVRIPGEGARVINAQGLLLVPAFTDLWAHLGEPGYEYRESFATGSHAAVCGGYGTVTAAPGGTKITDNPVVLRARIREAEAESQCETLFCAALTKGCEGRQLCSYDELASAGAAAFSDGEGERMSDDLLYAAMSSLASADRLMIAHPTRPECYAYACATAGRISKMLGVNAVPAAAETLALARYVLYSAQTGCRVHLCGVTTAASVELIAEAKRKSIPITASTSPQYFSFSEDELIFYGARAKVWPPLRPRSDVRAVIGGLRDGTIDCITTAHTPLTANEKGSRLGDAADGTICLQTAFSAASTYLLNPGALDIYRLCELMSAVPAKILGREEPRLRDGEPARFNLITLDGEFVVTNNYLKSRSQNSVFLGLTLRGNVAGSFISNPATESIS